MINLAKPKLRFRWRRLATILIGLYLAYWCGVSVHHIWVIAQQEQALRNKISMVQAQNRALSSDVKVFNNPSQLKAMLSGKSPFPDPTSP